MDCTGDQFFPGPALPLNQDRRSTAGYLADDLKYLDHISALSDKGRCARSLTEDVLQMTMVAYETTMFDGTRGHENQCVEVHRCRDVVEGAFLHGADRGVDRPGRCHNNERRFMGCGSKYIQDFHSRY